MVGRQTREIGLSGVVALVTGGGRGIGRAVAQALGAAGASVAVMARSAEQLAETVSFINEAEGKAHSVVADLRDRGAVEDAISQVEKLWGRIDLLVNNAGTITPLGPLGEADAEQWWRCLEINLRGAFLCTRFVLPGMCERRRGRIINVASGAALAALPNSSAYNISKAALVRLTEQTALENRPHGVSAFAVNPGSVRTSMSMYLLESEDAHQWMPNYPEHFAAHETPMVDLVSLMLLLASGRCDRLSGRLISVFDDVHELLERADEIERDDLYTLRLR